MAAAAVAAALPTEPDLPGPYYAPNYDERGVLKVGQSVREEKRKTKSQGVLRVGLSVREEEEEDADEERQSLTIALTDSRAPGRRGRRGGGVRR